MTWLWATRNSEKLLYSAQKFFACLAMAEAAMTKLQYHTIGSFSSSQVLGMLPYFVLCGKVVIFFPTLLLSSVLYKGSEADAFLQRSP